MRIFRRRRPRPPRPQAAPQGDHAKGGVVAYLRTVYVVLIAIVVLAVTAEVLYHQNELVDSFAPNVATESMGILLVVVFVQRYLERQERANRLRSSIGGLRKASRALQRLADAWGQLVKGTLPRVPETLPRDFTELFATHYTEELAHCDPWATRGTPGSDALSWVRWTAREAAEACALLNQIIIAYSGALDPAYVEAIDELVDDPFVGEFLALTASPCDAKQWRIQMNTERALCESHFARLSAAVAQHNDLAREAASVRTRRTAPRTGTIGMELPLDHDLRVDVELSKRWWNAQPAVGALRARLEREAI